LPDWFLSLRLINPPFFKPTTFCILHGSLVLPQLKLNFQPHYRTALSNDANTAGLKQFLHTIDFLFFPAGFHLSFLVEVFQSFNQFLLIGVLSFRLRMAGIVLSFDWVPPFICQALLNRQRIILIAQLVSVSQANKPAFLSVSFSLLRPNFR
jgi:hypothetical protein